jgi:hypothetical protein
MVFNFDLIPVLLQPEVNTTDQDMLYLSLAAVNQEDITMSSRDKLDARQGQCLAS